jgi:hypothetical protein
VMHRALPRGYRNSTKHSSKAVDQRVQNLTQDLQNTKQELKYTTTNDAVAQRPNPVLNRNVSWVTSESLLH